MDPHFRRREEKRISETLEFDSDRSAAVIAGSLVEHRLQAAISGRMVDDQPIHSKVFNNSGPLGTFSSKIDLAYLFGILSPKAHRELVYLKEIRNDFAHKLKISNFASDSIKAKARNLKLVETHVALMQQGEDADIANFGLDIPRIHVPRYEERLSNPRGRFLLTAQLFCYCLEVGRILAPNEHYI